MSLFSGINYSSYSSKMKYLFMKDKYAVNELIKSACNKLCFDYFWSIIHRWLQITWKCIQLVKAHREREEDLKRGIPLNADQRDKHLNYSSIIHQWVSKKERDQEEMQSWLHNFSKVPYRWFKETCILSFSLSKQYLKCFSCYKNAFRDSDSELHTQTGSKINTCQVPYPSKNWLERVNKTGELLCS